MMASYMMASLQVTISVQLHLSADTASLPRATMQGALILLPLGDEPPQWAARILRFSIQSAVRFFPMRLVMEDEAALQQRGGKYIVGGQLMFAMVVQGAAA